MLSCPPSSASLRVDKDENGLGVVVMIGLYSAWWHSIQFRAIFHASAYITIIIITITITTVFTNAIIRSIMTVSWALHTAYITSQSSLVHRWWQLMHLTSTLFFLICVFVFVNQFLCICISVFVYVFLYFCFCICVFVFLYL